MKKIFWEGTDHWDELLMQRAEISGKLALSDFTKKALSYKGDKNSYEDWKNKFQEETGSNVEDAVWETMEKINVKPLYTEDDIKDLEHLDYMSGIPPFLRGPYSTMYVARPWTVRQYAGFSTAEESK